MTTSILSSKSAWVANLRPSLTARRAASLTILASSAPEAPEAIRAILLKSTLSATLILRACTFRISSLPFRSGSSTGTRLSKRPGRNSAGSRLSGRLVAARMITPLLPSNPSISVNSWFNVCSLSSFPPTCPSRFLPMASISSINTIQGAFSFACLNRSLTLDAPIPTNISTNSEPDMEKKGTLASPATALANIVFPVPGGPTKRIPFGMEAPISLYLSGSCRYSTISVRFSFASSSPATSVNLIPLEDFT